MEILFDDLNKNNNQFKNEKNMIINKGSNYDVPLIENNKQNNLFLRKDYNIGDYRQFKFNTSDNQKTIDINTNTINNEYKYRITRVNIDSKNRNIIPKNIVSNETMSLSNPFSVEKNSNIITITAYNHGLSINDKITIGNVTYPEYYLDSFELTENSEYIKIYHQNHGMVPFDGNTIYVPYKIKIENITNNGASYIQNVPINYLNDYHTVYFNTNNTNDYDPDFYYIKTDNIFSSASIIYNNIYFKIIYRHIYGIPISNLNANYPIIPDRQKGYHIVNGIIDKNTFTIVVDSVANDTNNNCGGEYVTINKISDYIEGYPDNNNYKISLNKTFYNVSKIKLISTEFPNTEKTIKDYPLVKQNNLLFWQTLNNADYTYKIAITPGNYNVIGLITEIQKQIESTNIFDVTMDVNTNTIEYDNKFKADISIDINSSIFQINFYNQLNAIDPLKISQSNTDKNIYYVEVIQPNHLLQAGTQIKILNSTDIGKVPNTVLNGLHTIESIINSDSYLIKLPRFNTINTDSTQNTGGGAEVQIRYPVKARLLFDKPGTLGNILGFRNVGQNSSITSWAVNITNNTPYVNDILVDSVGKTINNTIINNYINLNGDNYILMANPLFKNTLDTGNLNGVFAKLLLAGLPGYILFNQYIQLGDEFTESVQTLSELEFSFYAPDGSLYSFNGIDHSFTVEIYERILDNENLNRKFNQINHTD
jgi:hypothetical protein